MKKGESMSAKVLWNERLSFKGVAEKSGFSLSLDGDRQVGGDENGFRPMEMFLLGLAGCTAMDVISILQKKQQAVTAFEVQVSSERASEHPKVFTKILVEYIVTGNHLDPAAVDRAVELSVTRYCPAQAMLAPVVPIEHKITLIDAA